MNRPHSLVTITSVLAASFATAAFAGVTEVQPLNPEASVATTDAMNETPQLWLVELASPPGSDGTPVAKLRAEKAAFRAAAGKAGIRFTERFSFDTLFNGISMAARGTDVLKLRRLDGVKAVHPVLPIPMPQGTPVLDPDLFTAVTMTGADIAQSELGLTGQGIKVAVMDTGIDYDNADLGGDGAARSNSSVFPNSRVVAGYDLVGDAYNADPSSPAYNVTLNPDAYPDDCAGHGTHVAGIVGANGTVMGVAPRVQLGAYRVFGCAGSTNDDVMIAAMERALADGMQVLNMSIGSSFESWPQAPTAAAATRLVNRGVVVVASIGNSGANGLYAAGAPGVGTKVIGVASYDNIRVAQQAFHVSPDALAIGYNSAAAAPPAPTEGSLPLARTGTPTTTNDGCAALPAGSLAGQAALIRRGTCTFYAKAMNAQNAGAAAVVLYNNGPGALNPTVAGTPPVTIPVVAVTAADGVTINGRIADGATTLTWSTDVVSTANATGNLISSFSSYGLAADLSLKPDLGAPGGYIWSTYPIELGGHTSLSGTSMASPHVAGAVALLLEAKPHTPSQVVGGILRNTAVPKPWWGNPALGFLDNVSRQGAGMLRIDEAVLSTSRIEPAKLALGESQAGPKTVTFTVENNGAADVTYDLSSVNGLSVSNTFSPAFFTSDATVTFSAPSVVVSRGGKASVSATIVPASGPDKAQYGGYVVFTPRGGGIVERVPFAGFVGNYQSIQVLAPTPNGFPWLAKLSGTSFTNQPAGATYTMAGDDVPFFLVHFDHQPQMFRIDIRDAVSGKSWFMADREQFLPRNSTATSFFSFPWDGVTFNGGGKPYIVPNGRYVATISVLKALGNDANPADWETWASPVITIARP